MGRIAVDRVGFSEALDAIDALVEAGEGGAIFTPNVDHVVLAEEHEGFRAAYDRAELCLADGMPVVWASRLLGMPCPEKLSGSDLFLPLMDRAAARRWRVYLLGSTDAVLRIATGKLRERGVEVVGAQSPWIRDPADAAANAGIYRDVRAARPHLLVAALGAPKQELWIHHARPHLGPVVSFGLGASLDFFAGAVRRAPAWMSRNGLEWLYRLAHEPGRLWKRYLLHDPAFARIVLTTWRAFRSRHALQPRLPAAP